MADKQSREVNQTLSQVGNDAEQAGKKIGDIMVKLDFSDALTGLKAIQREARKATAALKELEEQNKGLIEVSSTNKHCLTCGSKRVEHIVKRKLNGDVWSEQKQCMRCGERYND